MTRSEVYVRCKVYDAAKAISCAFRGVCVELQNLRRPIASDVGRSELVKALASYFFGLDMFVHGEATYWFPTQLCRLQRMRSVDRSCSP